MIVDASNLVTVREAAAEIGVTVGRVYQMLWANELPCHEVLGKKGIPREAVKKAAAEPRQTGRPRSGR